MKGVDVSSYQGKIEWKNVAADGYQFAILRGVVKNGTMDTTFFYNYENALSNGLDVSAYQFSYALSESEGAEAARNMISKLRGIKLPVWLDLEWNKQGILGKRKVTDIAKAYMDVMNSQGYECHIYSNLDWYKNKYYSRELKDLGCKFWIARYANSGKYVKSLKPEVGETIWQWTSKGAVKGITGNVDLNIAYEQAPQTVMTFSLKKDGEKKISENFKVKEFRCKDGSDVVLVDSDFVRSKLQKIRTHFGKPLRINSAYRTETYNKRIGGASRSYHMSGRAFDIVVDGVQPKQVAKYAQDLGIKGIILYKAFVHVDSRDTKYWAVDYGKPQAVNSF